MPIRERYVLDGFDQDEAIFYITEYTWKNNLYERIHVEKKVW